MDPRYEIPAVRAEAPPVIDGVLDDAVWQDAPQITGFIDVDLNRPADHQTIVRVLYDDEHLYFGFEMLVARPERIQSTERRRDRSRLRSEDYIQVSLDTFRDRRTAYMFLVSPLGTQWDASDGLFGRHVSWEANWQSATTIGEDRWTAEVAIPIREMLFSPGEDVTWGLNFRRRTMDGDRTSMWRYNPERGAPRGGSGPQATADFGILTGLDLTGVQLRRFSGAGVYVSGEGIRERDGETTSTANTGADVALRLAPQWMSNFTINPDFGQVEADPDTIELRDTERLLLERRPFFNEGVEMFQTPIRIYHSRRILDIDAGAKITGTGRDWSMGLINIQGNSFRPGRTSEGQYHIGRAIWNVGESSELGASWTAVNREEGYNVVAGLDHRMRLRDTMQLTSQLVAVRDKESERFLNEHGREEKATHRFNGHAFYSELANEIRPLTWELSYTNISENFQPELGFIPRRNIRGPSVDLNYQQEFGEGLLRSYSVGGEFTHYQNQAGQTVLRDYRARGGFRTRNHHQLSFWHDRNFRAPYHNRVTGVRLGLNQDDYYRSIEASISKGIFQDIPYHLVTVAKPFRVGERFTSLLSFQRRIEEHIDQDSLFFDTHDRVIWLARSISEYTFRWEGRVRLTMEQSSEDRFNRTLLLAYENVKPWDYYLVLTNSKARGIEAYGAFTKFVYHF